MPELPDLLSSDTPEPFSGLTPDQSRSALAPFLGYAGDVISGRAALDRLTSLLGPGSDRPLGSLASEALNPEALQRAGEIGLSFGPGMTKTAFHGTPHMFEPVEHNPFGEFKNEAIGSGEGAQAYGYGHYVAGNPKVAKDYAEKLSSDTGGFPTYKGENFWTTASKKMSEDELYQAWKGVREFVVDSNPENAIKRLTSRADEFEKVLNELSMVPMGGGLRQDVRDAREAAKWLSENKEHLGWQDQTPGSLLEVHVRPEEHELLDWDKPLSEQSASVVEGLTKLANQTRFADPDSLFTKSVFNSHKGETMYKSLSSDTGLRDIAKSLFPSEHPEYDLYTGTDEMASQALHSAGIPGIKYLDAGSRNLSEVHAQAALDSWKQDINNIKDQNLNHYNTRMQDLETELIRAQNPTYNYVIFDPSNLKIIGRNGQRLDPIEHDPFSKPESK